MVAGRRCGVWESGGTYKIGGAKGHFVFMVSSAGSAWQTSAARGGLKTWTCGGQRLGWNKPSSYRQVPLTPSFFFFNLPLPICWQKFYHLCLHRDSLGCAGADQHGMLGLWASETCGPPGNGQDSLEHRQVNAGYRGGSWWSLKTQTPIIRPSHRLLGPGVIFFTSVLAQTGGGEYR